MKTSLRLLAFLPLALAALGPDLVGCTAEDQGAETSDIKASDRKAILDALRKVVAADLNRQASSVKFVIPTHGIKTASGWATVTGTPVQADGSPMDYSGTKYQTDIDQGLFDDGVQALLHKVNGVWTVVHFAIGCTDVCSEPWAPCYGAPESLWVNPSFVPTPDECSAITGSLGNACEQAGGTCTPLNTTNLVACANPDINYETLGPDSCGADVLGEFCCLPPAGGK